MHFHLVGHWHCCTEGYLVWGTHIIAGGNEGVTFYVSFQKSIASLAHQVHALLIKQKVSRRDEDGVLGVGGSGEHVMHHFIMVTDKWKAKKVLFNSNLG